MQGVVDPTAFDPGVGFADPVFQSQAAFRTLLAALSEPGTIHALEGAVTPPAGFAAATALSLLTLADYETPLWLDPTRREGAAGHWARFHCAVPFAASPAEAVFAVLDGAAAGPKLAAFNGGSDLFPDTSTTLIIECAAFEGGETVTLSGPGIETTRTIEPAGLRAGFWDEVAANNALYPLGVDMLLVAGHRIMGLPRSTLVMRDGGEG